MVVGVIANAFLGTHFRQQLLVACGAQLVAVLGIVLIVALPLSNNVGHLIGYYLCYMGACPLTTALTMISSNIAGYTKKTTVAGLYVIAYCVGNIIGESKIGGQGEENAANAASEELITISWQVRRHFDLKTPRDTYPQRSRSLYAGRFVSLIFCLSGGGTAGRTLEKPGSGPSRAIGKC